jgi:hypothetical protein
VKLFSRDEKHETDEHMGASTLTSDQVSSIAKLFKAGKRPYEVWRLLNLKRKAVEYQQNKLGYVFKRGFHEGLLKVERVAVKCIGCGAITEYIPSKVQPYCSWECFRKTKRLVAERYETVSGRFWKNVNKTDSCWLWIGYGKGDGYGQFWTWGREMPAHWFLLPAYPWRGIEACHKCDNPLCVNPKHIFLGTRSENVQDSIRKGRFRKHWNGIPYGR